MNVNEREQYMKYQRGIDLGAAVEEYYLTHGDIPCCSDLATQIIWLFLSIVGGVVVPCLLIYFKVELFGEAQYRRSLIVVYLVIFIVVIIAGARYYAYKRDISLHHPGKDGILLLDHLYRLRDIMGYEILDNLENAAHLTREFTWDQVKAEVLKQANGTALNALQTKSQALSGLSGVAHVPPCIREDGDGDGDGDVEAGIAMEDDDSDEEKKEEKKEEKNKDSSSEAATVEASDSEMMSKLLESLNEEVEEFHKFVKEKSVDEWKSMFGGECPKFEKNYVVNVLVEKDDTQVRVSLKTRNVKYGFKFLKSIGLMSSGGRIFSVPLSLVLLNNLALCLLVVVILVLLCGVLAIFGSSFGAFEITIPLIYVSGHLASSAAMKERGSEWRIGQIETIIYSTFVTNIFFGFVYDIRYLAWNGGTIETGNRGGIFLLLSMSWVVILVFASKIYKNYEN